MISINATNDFNRNTTTMNFVIVIQFFDFICKNVFEHLLIVSSSKNDFCDSIFTYFNIVKTNNRDILYLHYFLWFRKTNHITNFRNRIFTNSNYDIRMIRFINRTIKRSIVSTAESFVSISNASLANLNESLKEFIRKLFNDSNAIVLKKQMHSFSHNVTCFKYIAVFINKCQFGFFRVCVERTEHDSIEFYKDNV